MAKKRKAPPRPLPAETKLPPVKLAGIGTTVVLRWGKLGGCFYLSSGKEKAPRIDVGCDDNWPGVAAVVMHEALELVLTLSGHRFKPCQGWGHNHADYIFHLDHNAFCQAVDKLADFTTCVLPRIKAEYDARVKEHRRRKLPALGT